LAGFESSDICELHDRRRDLLDALGMIPDGSEPAVLLTEKEREVLILF
jgi:hypothetical protein